MIDVYEGHPDDVEIHINGLQDDILSEPVGLVGRLATSLGQRDVKETLAWYASHRNTQQLGYNPNGMCLKICRQARNLPSLYPSAVSAQNATPAKHRITRLQDIVPGMVMYFDDPNDNNPFGHIVTVKDVSAKIKSLDDILTPTNSVKSGQIVDVRASYFPNIWGDRFQFASDWLNGEELILPAKPKPVKKPPLNKATNLRNAIKDLEKAVKYHQDAGHPRLVKALKRDIAAIRETIKKFS